MVNIWWTSGLRMDWKYEHSLGWKQKIMFNVWRDYCFASKNKFNFWSSRRRICFSSNYFKVNYCKLKNHLWFHCWFLYKRCGVLYMDPGCLHWNLIVKTWIRTFPRFIPDAIRVKLSTMFDRFCVPLLKVSNLLESLEGAMGAMIHFSPLQLE